MSKKKQPLPMATKTEAELAYIIDYIKNSAIPDFIKDFILAAIENALWFPYILQQKSMSLKRLKFMLFGAGYRNKSAESLASAISNKINTNGMPDTSSEFSVIVDLTDVDANMTATNTKEIEILVNKAREQKAPESNANVSSPGHGRMAHTAYENFVEYFLSIEGLKSGDPCPLNCGGKVYEFNPKMPRVLLRIVGQEIAEVRKIVVERLRCNLCHYLIQAEIPDWVGIEKYDAAFKAWLVLQKYRIAVPFYRQEIFQRLLDFPLPDATQWDLVEQVAGYCYPIFNLLVFLAANSELLHKDDTRVIIQEIIQYIKNNPDIKRTGMYTTGVMAEHDGHKIALFFNGAKHAGENVAALLKKRLPDKPPIIQMCDALSANISKDVVDIVCNCLSHGFRKFDEIVNDFPTPCITIMKLLSIAYDNDAKTKGMEKQARLEHHQQHSKPAMELLARYMQALFDEKLVEPNSELGKALKYMQKHWHKLTRFLTVAGAPLCNNVIERALKVAIMNRKNAMFYRTSYSAQIGGMHTSIVYTCELNNVNPYHYLIALQTNTAAIQANPQQWLPWNYHLNFNHPPNAAASSNLAEHASVVVDPAAVLAATQQHAMH